MSMKSEGFVAGKQIFVFGSGPQRTTTELREFMRRFSTRSVLRRLGTVSRRIWDHHQDLVFVGGVPIVPHCILYLALVSIEVANDHRARPFDEAALVEAARMFLNLEEPLTELQHPDDQAAGKEHMLRQGQHQFGQQSEMRHLYPRTALLLRDAWAMTPEAKSVDPLADLLNITGLTLDEMFMLARASIAISTDGCLRPSKMKAPPHENWPFSKFLTEPACEQFFAWTSANYKTIREEARKHDPPRPSYDQYRFNPLRVHPLVRPDLPDLSEGTTYFVPNHRLVLERVTSGLYHDLLNHHMGGKGENPFKVAFGYVFSNYVGLLLREALQPGTVHVEWKFGNATKPRDTPDWIVIEGTRAVVVEVKQSGLFLATKTWGHLPALRLDLKKTLGEAASQLASFDDSVAADTPGLERLKNVTDYEHLIVSYDSLHWGNSVIRDEMQASLGRPTFHVHIASIEEFEYILGRCWQGSLFDLLRSKRGDTHDDMMDFKDWMGHHPVGQDNHGNPFLSAKYNELLVAVGLPPVIEATAHAESAKPRT
jgi:hypothetical protein